MLIISVQIFQNLFDIRQYIVLGIYVSIYSLGIYMEDSTLSYLFQVFDLYFALFFFLVSIL